MHVAVIDTIFTLYKYGAAAISDGIRGIRDITTFEGGVKKDPCFTISLVRSACCRVGSQSGVKGSEGAGIWPE